MRCDHEWEQVGGRNAGCCGDCQCSVPVMVCTECGECDYGDNAEAKHIIDNCTIIVRAALEG